MKRLLVVLMIVSVAGVPVFAREQTILARITVYWPIGTDGHRAYSNGARLRNGHCAVDPKQIPFGSKVIFPDGDCLAVDTGPAVVKRVAARRCAKTSSERKALVIDRYFETKREALAWAAAHPHFINVRVVDPQRATARLIDVVERQHPRQLTDVSEARSGAGAVQQAQATPVNICAIDSYELPANGVRAPLIWFGGSQPRS